MASTGVEEALRSGAIESRGCRRIETKSRADITGKAEAMRKMKERDVVALRQMAAKAKGQWKTSIFRRQKIQRTGGAGRKKECGDLLSYQKDGQRGTHDV